MDCREDLWDCLRYSPVVALSSADYHVLEEGILLAFLSHTLQTERQHLVMGQRPRPFPARHGLCSHSFVL